MAPRVQLSQSIAASRNSAIVEAAARVAPAVVSVNVVRRERRVPRSVFDWLWMPRGFEREVQGLGSGFIISPDGVVITNEHVTGGASDIVVTTRDGTDYQATLLGEDPLTDIAVLRIDGGDFRTVPIGTSADLMIGEWVVAIGNPYGYLLGNTEPSVTAGVVSAVGRNIIPSGEDETVYVGMIQTDAAINPGNSGGPLINALGEVVGVNSSIFSASGGSVGVGFAIPIERALRIARELQRYGEVRRSWVGVSVAGSDRLRDWKRTGGLLITAVAGGSPAARAGMRDGDVLVSAGRRLLRTFLDWEAVKLDVSPGDNLRIVFRRDGRERRASVAVQDLPTSLAERVSVLGQIELITVTPPIRQERGIRSEQGALVYEIGAAAGRSTGLQAGDVIFRINRQQITHAEDVQRVFREAAGSRAPIRVYFERSGGRGWTDFYVR
ncbi:MAG: trypsin-like serine protease [Gemmatimonadales bacterium]|nr:trypsin-like serine protease [Gemmatimonadales bacterium]